MYILSHVSESWSLLSIGFVRLSLVQQRCERAQVLYVSRLEKVKFQTLAKLTFYLIRITGKSSLVFLRFFFLTKKSWKISRKIVFKNTHRKSIAKLTYALTSKTYMEVFWLTNLKKLIRSFNQWDNLLSFLQPHKLHHQSDPLVNDEE